MILNLLHPPMLDIDKEVFKKLTQKEKDAVKKAKLMWKASQRNKK